MSDWMIDATEGDSFDSDKTLALMHCDVRGSVDAEGRFRVQIDAQDQHDVPFSIAVRASEGCDLRAIDVLGRNLAQILSDAAERSQG